MQQREDERTGLPAGRLLLEIPADAAALRLARLFAASVARHAACDEDDVEDVKIAISEACTSSIKAHEAATNGEPIQIIAEVADSHVVFEIVDRAAAADASANGTGTPPAGLYDGSLGLSLMRSLFDDAEITANADGGTTVRFSVACVPDIATD